MQLLDYLEYQSTSTGFETNNEVICTRNILLMLCQLSHFTHRLYRFMLKGVLVIHGTYWQRGYKTCQAWSAGYASVGSTL